ncbi:hypothetical protein ES319_A01G126000v1 [Gossypium barbadense]|uniref:Small VCP/p97-interacting protein n=1 Tax=Gossypium barbadense TaxID=3634 RepID=A0A5J5WZF5_GOSBA|nr:hypothetical protein ES319_A01G126000v1 [Gossypium barbadense]
MGCFACFDGGNREQRKEQHRLASAEARAKAAEAAQRRRSSQSKIDPFIDENFLVFEKSAAGRAARAQLQAAAKQSTNSNKGEPALKWQMG